MKRKFWTILVSAFLALVLCMGTVACANNASDYEADETKNYSISASRKKSADGTSIDGMSADVDTDVESVTDTRKLIKTYNIEAETQQYDSAVKWLDAKVTSCGGYYESKSEQDGSLSYYYNSKKYCRQGAFVIRVPAEEADAFLAELEEQIHFTYRDEDATDVTEAYSDVEGHLTALRAQEARLVELMASAKNLSEIIELEDKLADVRYEIESYEKQLRGYDNKIQYVTIYLDLDEVEEFTEQPEPTFWEELSESFQESLVDFGEGWEDFVIWFVSAQPGLLTFGAISVGIFFIVRAIVRGAKKRKAKKQEENK